jgi:formylglycine-generating enzyme required for sulfatase activity
MDDKENELGEIELYEEKRIARHQGGGLLSRGLSDLHRIQNRTKRREFEFTTVQLDEYGDEVERRTGRACEVVEKLPDGTELEMVEIPYGLFWMGSTGDEVDNAISDAVRWYGEDYEYHAIMDWIYVETPRHLVTVKYFLLGKYPVTQAQWRAVMGNLPDMDVESIGDNRPVVNVTWNNAVQFCYKLKKMTGNKYRLPSEAEWEYAAKAGTITPFAFGENISTEIVNYAGTYPYGKAIEGILRDQTVNVGSLRVANDFGLYDMHGNVSEWCLDEWHDSYVDAPVDGRAWGDSNWALKRVVRGGNCGAFGFRCRSAYRDWHEEPFCSSFVGFRLAITLA